MYRSIHVYECKYMHVHGRYTYLQLPSPILNIILIANPQYYLDCCSFAVYITHPQYYLDCCSFAVYITQVQ
jgi:hypothetical protein